MSFRLKSMRAACLAGAAVLVLTTAAACSSNGSTTPQSVSSTGGSLPSAPVKTGGSITVLESSGYAGAWSTLDPAQNKEGAATQDFMTAIYGELFHLGTGGKIVDDLATGYTYSPDAKTVTITLRQGVKFTDNTPFNAQAVYYNWMRDLGPIAIANGLAPAWLVADQPPKKGAPPGATPALPGDITMPGPYTLVVHQIAPNGAFIDQLFDSIANWIASPTAIQKEGKAFGQTPVGAGPFEVASNVPNNELIVKKNPTYWEAGHPLLDNITFKTVGSDEAAYEALLANQGQVYEDMSTTALINQSASHFEVENNLGTSPYDLQLNTAVPPFNSAKARQAIYAATNFQPILQRLFGGRYPIVQGFTGPGGICYQQFVKGYQGYDPTLAKTLIQQSGLAGTTIQLGTIALSTAQDSTNALATQWENLGLKVKVSSWPLAGLINAFTVNSGKNWQAMVQTAGAYDPAGGIGVGFRFDSKSEFSGVHDPALDKLLAEASGSTSLSTRCGFYNQAAAYIAKNFYGPFYFAFSPANISVHGIQGPGLSTALASVAVVPTIPWEDVYYNPSSS